MAVRSEVFRDVGGFRRDFGKVGGVSRPEDTDLCIRIGRQFPRSSVLFVPDAVVDHHVGFERAEFSFFLKRCYSEGRGKVELARNNLGLEDLDDERTYIRNTLPHAFVSYLREAVHDRDIDQLRRAGALVGGMGMAGAGAAFAMWRNRTVRQDVSPLQ
jgi:GT2 family glycosyltransferase